MLMHAVDVAPTLLGLAGLGLAGGGAGGGGRGDGFDMWADLIKGSPTLGGPRQELLYALDPVGFEGR